MTDRQTLSQTRIPLFFLREGLSLGSKTYHPFWDYICWSLRWLGRGQLPPEDFFSGKRLCWTKTQKALLNTTFAVTELRGDWKYQKEILNLSSFYNSRNTCHRCCATQKAGPLDFGQFGHQAGWVATERTNAEFIRTCLPNLDDPLVNPLVFLPDFHVSQLKACFMHVAHLGVGLFTNGSAMIFLMETGHLGNGTRDDQLAVLWKEFKEWRRSNRVSVSIPAFRSYCLHDNDKGQTWYHSKAWHSRILTSFLAAFLSTRSRQRPDDSHLAMVATCVYRLGELYNAVECEGRYVSESVSGCDYIITTTRLKFSSEPMFLLLQYSPKPVCAHFANRVWIEASKEIELHGLEYLKAYAILASRSAAVSPTFCSSSLVLKPNMLRAHF